MKDSIFIKLFQVNNVQVKSKVFNYLFRKRSQTSYKKYNDASRLNACSTLKIKIPSLECFMPNIAHVWFEYLKKSCYIALLLTSFAYNEMGRSCRI